MHILRLLEFLASRSPVLHPSVHAEVAGEVPCAVEGTVCGPLGAEYCACWNSPTDGLSWDCDDPPSTWGL